LAARFFGEGDAAIPGLLSDEGRKSYYRKLVKEFPQVFLEGVAEERKSTVLGGIERDIDASRPGPDVLIARMIENQHSRREAANYLRVLMLGKVG
jgi:hypothetical protein